MKAPIVGEGGTTALPNMSNCALLFSAVLLKINIPFEWQVGLRYTRAGKRRSDAAGVKSGNGFISFISAISMAGIALGVAALIVVLSVMNGFQDELRNRILAVASHIEVRSVSGNMENWQAVARIAGANPRVKAQAPYVL
jgi:lipoprotein-releasing system permease protein